MSRLEEMLKSLFEGPKEKTVVAVITGDLYVGFQKLTMEKALIRFEVDAAKEQHNLNVLREHIVDGILVIDVDDLAETASNTWKIKNAEQIADWGERADAAKAHEKDLWSQIYETYSLNPDGKYSVDARTGEVELA